MGFFNNIDWKEVAKRGFEISFPKIIMVVIT